jgi:hypothetical protein
MFLSKILVTFSFLYKYEKITKILDKVVILLLQKSIKTIVNISLYIHM